MKSGSPLLRFVRSSGTITMLYGISTLLSFLVGTLLARMLGPVGYGAYAIALTSATLAGIVTEFGLPVLAMREAGVARASGDWGGVKGLLSWSDRAILALSLVAAFATWAWFEWWAAGKGQMDRSALMWGVAMIPLVALAKLRSWVLLAMERTFASQFPLMVLRPALFIAICLIFWRLMGSLTPATAMAAQAGGAAVVFAIVAIQFSRMRPVELATAHPRTLPAEWIASCLPMGLTEGLRLLQGQIGLLLTGALAGTAQAGLYRVADSAAQITALAASIAGTAATPMFARLWREGDREGLERVAVGSAWMAMAGGLVLGMPLVVFGDKLFPWVFGPDFAPSARIFLVLWCGGLAFSSFGLCQALANMTGQHVLATKSFGVIAVANICLGLVLVPRAGALGAATASAIASSCGALFCSTVLRKRSGINATAFNLRMAAGGFRWLKEKRKGQACAAKENGQ